MADIVFTLATPPPAVLGVTYECGVSIKGMATAVTANSIQSGALPAGITLTAAPEMRLTGVPTVTGTFTFTVSATDGAGAVVSGAYTLIVYGFEGDDGFTGRVRTPAATLRQLRIAT